VDWVHHVEDIPVDELMARWRGVGALVDPSVAPVQSAHELLDGDNVDGLSLVQALLHAIKEFIE